MSTKIHRLIRRAGRVSVGPVADHIATIVSARVEGPLDESLDRKLAVLSRQVDSTDSNRRITQQLLFHQYQMRRDLRLPMPSFGDTGFRVYSQSDEDGLLLYVFSLIGMRTRVCVDVASGVPDGANSTNLIRNWGFRGLLFEADEQKVNQARAFFAHPDTNVFPPYIKRAMITAENINELIAEEASGEIDLFSLDMDGVDYWIWKALYAVRPRVVICEFNSYWGAEQSVTIPYNPLFTRPHKNYWGASLPAFVKLASEKGYRLVGINRYGYNAIFVRNELATDLLPTVSPQQCLQGPLVDGWRSLRFADFPDTTKHPWVEV